MVGLFFAAVWGIAIWGQDHFDWGIASGQWVGLYCCCASMKVTSFAVEMYRAAIRAAGTAYGPGNARGEVQQGHEPAEAEQVLTFKEYLFFLFLAPTATCEIHLLKTSARRPSRPLRAASEFLHSVLIFLVLHIFVGNVLAPAMRLLTAGLLSSSWAGGANWTAVKAMGRGGWLPGAISSATVLDTGLVEDSPPWWGVLGSVLWLFILCHTVAGFLGFYGFWHCICLGMAELWGFPDHHLYGEESLTERRRQLFDQMRWCAVIQMIRHG